MSVKTEIYFKNGHKTVVESSDYEKACSEAKEMIKLKNVNRCYVRDMVTGKNSSIENTSRY